MAEPVPCLKDAAYTVVGFAVIGVQRAQVQRREVERWLSRIRDEVTRCGKGVGHSTSK